MGVVVSIPNPGGVDFVAAAISRLVTWEIEMDARSAGNAEMQLLMRGTLTCSAELSCGVDYRVKGLNAAERRVRKWLGGKRPIDPSVAARVLERIRMVTDDLEDGIERTTLRIDQLAVCCEEREAWTCLAAEVRERLATTALPSHASSAEG